MYHIVGSVSGYVSYCDFVGNIQPYFVVVLTNKQLKALKWSCEPNCTILYAVSQVFTHLVIEGLGESNSKLQWDSGDPSLLPVVVGINLLNGQTSMGVVWFLQTLVPALHHVMRRKELLVVGVAFLVLVHVDVSHLCNRYIFWIAYLENLNENFNFIMIWDIKSYLNSSTLQTNSCRFFNIHSFGYQLHF